MWKALSNALTVGERLIARGMKTDSRCQRCGREDESINHVLFECPVARLVWAQSGFPFPRSGFENRNLFENFDYLMRMGKNKSIREELTRVFPWILWIIWKNKNVFCVEGREFSADETVAKAQDDARPWFEAQKGLKEERSLSSRQREEPWRAPATGFMKCNISVSWSRKNQMSGASWIVRNCRGEVVVHSRRGLAGLDHLQRQKLLE